MPPALTACDLQWFELANRLPALPQRRPGGPPLQLLIERRMQRCRDSEELQLVDDHATAESELIGPFQVPIPLIHSASDGHTPAHDDGMAVAGAIAPGSDS